MSYLTFTWVEGVVVFHKSFLEESMPVPQSWDLLEPNSPLLIILESDLNFRELLYGKAIISNIPQM